MCRMIVAGTLLFFVSGCAQLGLFAPLERRIIFQPAPYPTGEWHPPELAFEDAWIETDDGTELHGWFVEHPRPRAVALIAHGNAGNITSRAESLRILNERHGLSVLIFDYRGFGRSQGSPTESNLLADARAARRWLARRTGVAEQDIVLMGRSLGGAVVVDLAAKDGARGLVIASTFTSLPDVGAHHYPWLPIHWMMSHRLNSLDKITSFDGPLLQSHGDSDEVIPIELGRQLHDAAPGPKQFIVIPGGRHNSPQSEEYRIALDAFLNALPPPTTPSVNR